MKINNGFVTNSSSTSFIISSKNQITKEKFMKEIGVKNEALLNTIFEELFAEIENVKEEVPQNVDIQSFFENNGIRITEEDDIKEIEKRYKSGEKVYYGEFPDDQNVIVTFFCHESFVVIGDNFYFNARNCAY